MAMSEKREERENRKSLKRTQKNFVRVTDNEGNRFTFDNAEWIYFSSFLPILNKYLVRLFYDQQFFKLYIDQVVCTNGYVAPQFYFPTFFNTSDSNRLDRQLTFDRLYDELRMRGKVEVETS